MGEVARVEEEGDRGVMATIQAKENEITLEVVPDLRNPAHRTVLDEVLPVEHCRIVRMHDPLGRNLEDRQFHQCEHHEFTIIKWPA